MAGNDDGAWQHENEHAEEDFLPDVSLAEGSKPTRYRNGRTYGSYFSRDGEALTRRQRLLLLGGCIFTCLLTAGIFFGYAALKSILIKQGVYSELCDEEPVPGEEFPTCNAQSLRLDLMYTLATVANSGIALLTGLLLDRTGPRICVTVGLLALLTGTLLFAVSDSKTFDAYIPAAIIISMGSSLSYLPLLHLSDAFPRKEGLVMSLLTCSFDASALLFALFQGIVAATDVPLSTLFFIYATIPAAMIVFFWFLMPDIPFGATKLKAFGSSTEGILAMQRGELRLQPFLTQLRSKEFFLVTFYLSIYMLRSNYFIQSTYDHLGALPGQTPELRDSMVTVFSIVLAAGAVVAVPAVGWMLDHCSFFVTFMTVTCASITYSIFVMIPSIPLQYVNFVLFSVVRALLYSSVADYIGRRFGFVSFGRIFGSIFTVGAICGTLMYLFSFVSLELLDGNFNVVDGVLIGLQLLGVVFPLYERQYSKRMGKEHRGHASLKVDSTDSVDEQVLMELEAI